MSPTGWGRQFILVLLTSYEAAQGRAAFSSPQKGERMAWSYCKHCGKAILPETGIAVIWKRVVVWFCDTRCAEADCGIVRWIGKFAYVPGDGKYSEEKHG